MKLPVLFKNHHALNDALTKAFQGEVDNGIERERARKFITKFIKHGGYVIIEFDTKKKTAVVRQA